MALKLISMRIACERTLYSRSSVYRLIAQGQFPTPVKCGPRKTAFVESEVDEHIAARIAERSERRSRERP